MADKSPLLTPQEVAEHLNISRRKAYYLIEDGLIPHVKIGKNIIRVNRKDVEQIQREGTQ